MQFFGTRLKVLLINFTRSKVFKAKNTIIRTFDLVPKSACTTLNTRLKVLIMVLNFQSSEKSCKFFFGTRSKVLIMVFLALKNFQSCENF